MPTQPQQPPDLRPRDPVVVLLERIYHILCWILAMIVLWSAHILFSLVNHKPPFSPL